MVLHTEGGTGLIRLKSRVADDAIETGHSGRSRKSHAGEQAQGTGHGHGECSHVTGPEVNDIYDSASPNGYGVGHEHTRHLLDTMTSERPTYHGQSYITARP